MVVVGATTLPRLNGSWGSENPIYTYTNQETVVQQPAVSWGSNRGPQVSIVAPGWNVSAVKNATTDNARTADPGTAHFHGFGGTSAAAPFVAGVIAQVLRVNRALSDPNAPTITMSNQQAIEIVEATADKLPGLDTDHQGFGRVNFWKAVLTAANGHLSSQDGRRTLGLGGCPPFSTLEVKNDGSWVKYYGFEIRTKTPQASVWLREDFNGSYFYTALGENPQPLPVTFQPDPSSGIALTYAAVPKWAANNQHPFMPWGLGKLAADAEVAVCLTVTREYIGSSNPTFDPTLVVFEKGVDPWLGNPSPLVEVPLDDLQALRTAPGNVKEFSNFVFVIEE